MLHRRLIAQSGGALGVRDERALDAAIAQPRMTFDGRELYPTLEEKAVALAFSLIQNHPFVDGNKRIGHASLEVSLMLNGYELAADVDDAERVFLGVAASTTSRDELLTWVRNHSVPRAN